MKVCLQPLNLQLIELGGVFLGLALSASLGRPGLETIFRGPLSIGVAMKKQHCHDFVENYTGLLAQGLDRETDLATLQVYLQKLADDQLMEKLLPRLKAEEITRLFELINVILRHHLVEEEYHRLFLKDFPEGPRQF